MKPDPSWKQIATGFYDDGQGLHVDVPAVLRANGYADTPENRETLAAAARQIAIERAIEYIEDET
jgi:hypothetical protein